MVLLWVAIRLTALVAAAYGLFLAARAFIRWLPRERPSIPAEPTPVERPTGMAVDPVCQMPLLARPETRHLKHEGRTYYFCSSSCAERFSRAPHRYAKRDPGAGFPR